MKKEDSIVPNEEIRQELTTAVEIMYYYELKRNKPDMKVLMIEKGRRIERRACPKRKYKGMCWM